MRHIVEFDGYIQGADGEYVSGREREAVEVAGTASESELLDALDTQCARLFARRPRIVGTVDDSVSPGLGSDGQYYTR